LKLGDLFLFSFASQRCNDWCLVSLITSVTGFNHIMADYNQPHCDCLSVVAYTQSCCPHSLTYASRTPLLLFDSLLISLLFTVVGRVRNSTSTTVMLAWEEYLVVHPFLHVLLHFALTYFILLNPASISSLRICRIAGVLQIRRLVRNRLDRFTQTFSPWGILILSARLQPFLHNFMLVRVALLQVG
jgi:hypothetical protein